MDQNRMTDPATQTFYEQNAEILLREARQLLHEPFPLIERAFPAGCSVLDVGCGVGTDVLRLLRAGYDAQGAEPVRGLVDAGLRLAVELGLDASARLHVSALPELPGIADAAFDALHCAAVLMHLPPEMLFDAVYGLRRVLKPGGILLVSIPAQRADVDPSTRRDPRGRLFTELRPAELCLLLERAGFEGLWQETTPDRLRRKGITWTSLCLRLPREGAERPLHQVEGILNRDKKDATYKLALFRALADLAQTQTHVAEFRSDERVGIPTWDLALKWLYYYWPLLEPGPFIAQKNGEMPDCAKPTVVRTCLQPLVKAYQGRGGLTAFHADRMAEKLTPELRVLFSSAMKSLQHTIWNMPARYAGGGEDFSVFQYDRSRKMVLMQAALWRELCLTGSWIRDATLLRWAELCAGFSKGRLRPSEVVDRLLILPAPERRVQEAREVFLQLPERFCVWTNEALPRNFDVDHAIPFSLWRNNDLWNLFPSSAGVNNQKRDKIPTWNLVHHQQETIIHFWRILHEVHPIRFAREAQTLLGRDPFRDGNWEALLFARFAESMESTAIQRGSTRWEPATFTASRARKSSSAPTEQVATTPTVPAVLPQPELETPTLPHPLIPFAELGERAWSEALPWVGRLAAGPRFHGFTIENLDTEAPDCSWVRVPEPLARPGRFVVEVGGDSMEPGLPQGSFVIFEYHRHPREEGGIVIANLNELGTRHGTEAIKRLRVTPGHWEFHSDNPAYPPFQVERETCPYPILGTFVARLEAPII